MACKKETSQNNVYQHSELLNKTELELKRQNQELQNQLKMKNQEMQSKLEIKTRELETQFAKERRNFQSQISNEEKKYQSMLADKSREFQNQLEKKTREIEAQSEKEKNELRLQLENKTKEFETKLAYEKETFKSDLERERRKYQSQLAIKARDFQTQLENKTKEIEKLKSSERKGSPTESDDKTKEFETQLAKEKEEFQMKLEDITKEFETQLANEKKEFQFQFECKSKEIEEMQQKLKDINDKHKAEMKKQKEELTKIQTFSALQQQKFKAIEILDSESVRKLEKIEQIGFGNGGKVTKVSKKIFYALKEMNIQNASFENLQHFVGEYEIMNMLNHPNILKTHGIFFSDEELPPSILLEYCPQNLEQAVKKQILSKVDTIYSIYQIAEGMKYVHFRNIIHRDLKPSNILVSEYGIVKICDFGISRLMSTEEQSMTRGLGTQKYMAPEIINEENYNEKVDVYSFGVVVYFILTDGELPDIKIRDICLGKKAPIPSNFTSLSQQLIEACWTFDFKYRPSFKVICEILEQNNFELLNLSEIEQRELMTKIKQYKTLIPEYTE